jgi:ribosomal subunit interface protein
MMKGPSSSAHRRARAIPTPSAQILIQGGRVEIQPALHAAAVAKAAKLLRHHERVIRVRIDFDYESAAHCSEPAVASGRVEISGDDLVARAASTTLSSSLDRLVAKLDRMLRERTKQRVNRRNDRPASGEFRDLIAPTPLPSSQPH